MNTRNCLLPLALAALVMGGCTGTPVRDPAFAPPQPVVPPANKANNGAIYQTGYGVRLFEDQRARHVGDILTIVLQESTDATKQAGTTTKKENDVSMPAPTVFGHGVTSNGHDILNNDISTKQDFSGTGESTQSNSLTGSITVSVTQVLPNGYLVVRGEKVLTLNRGDEYVRLSGIVRPADISADNTVLSTQVANAQITYSGTGAVADASRHGWLSRFFLAFWPF